VHSKQSVLHHSVVWSRAHRCLPDCSRLWTYATQTFMLFHNPLSITSNDGNQNMPIE